MFGYVTIAADTLPKELQERYRAHYCGLCHILKARYGSLGRFTLSYDLTFLWLLLSSLYEPETAEGRESCLPHPLKKHPYVENPIGIYCGDMNIALAYHKCLDDWRDDHSLTGRAEAALLKPHYEKVKELYPEKCKALESCLQDIGQVEKSGEADPDQAANLTARMLGLIYRYREDEWADSLQKVGEALGRFVYVMDAYDDLPRDLKRKRYNPLRELSQKEDYEAFCKETLTMLIAECTQEFETLPLVQDVEILRNILYGGCWSRYRMKQAKRDKDKPAPAGK